MKNCLGVAGIFIALGLLVYLTLTGYFDTDYYKQCETMCWGRGYNFEYNWQLGCTCKTKGE